MTQMPGRKLDSPVAASVFVLIQTKRKRRMITDIVRKITGGRFTAVPVFLFCMLMWFLTTDGGNMPGQTEGLLTYVTGGYLPWLSSSRWVGLLLFSVTGFLLYEVHMLYSLIKVRTSFHLVTFLFLAAILPVQEPSAGHYASACLLFAVVHLFYATFKMENPFKIFQTGCYLSLAMMFYPPAIYLVPFFLLGIFTLNMMNLKAFCAFMLGLLFPFWTVFVVAFMLDDLAFFTTLAEDFAITDAFAFSAYSLTDWLALGYMFLLALCSSVYLMLSDTEEKTATRSFLYFFFTYTLACFVLIALFPADLYPLLFMQMPFTSVLAARFFVQSGKVVSSVLFIAFAIMGLALAVCRLTL